MPNQPGYHPAQHNRVRDWRHGQPAMADNHHAHPVLGLLRARSRL